MAVKSREKRFALREKHAARIVGAIMPHPTESRSLAQPACGHAYSQHFMARLCQIPEDYKVERVRVQ